MGLMEAGARASSYAGLPNAALLCGIVRRS
jgi:hypothetical protein